MTFRAGAAEVVITPPVGTFLDGYSSRSTGSTGVHDDLHARAIVVDDGATQAAIVGCDLIGVDRRLAAAVRQIVHEATGMPQTHVMVSATHTHAGPAGLRSDMNPELTDITARLIAGAIVSAHAKLRPAVVKAGRGSVDSVSQNRRHPDGPIDDALHVLLFDSPDPRDGAIASIVNFACHATVMFATNMEISADYPGQAVATVKKVLGDAPVVFLNGACGDVNPSWIEQRFEETERVGSIVGAEATRRLQELRPLGVRHKTWNIRWDELTDKPVTSGALIAEPRIRVASKTVDVPMRRLDAPEAYDESIAGLRRQMDALNASDVDGRRRLMAQLTQISGDRGVAARQREGGPHYLHPEVQAISLGRGQAILGLPGEFFAETAQRLRQDAALDHLSIACYTNHHVFYVVPHHAFDEGGYEPGVAVLDGTAEATLRDGALDLLRSVTS
ncbi:MAG TPA: neutral/alkaline non-lysosomal ceramidase N-terminal domain-containing protein [Dehalococcoidia bacterium]|nr:neutral/alkaline non-lysosomal ceramidase N-terminal domain-containing protein [Dehalococcoidia bacterium]